MILGPDTHFLQRMVVYDINNEQTLDIPFFGRMVYQAKAGDPWRSGGYVKKISGNDIELDKIWSFVAGEY